MRQIKCIQVAYSLSANHYQMVCSRHIPKKSIKYTLLNIILIYKYIFPDCPLQNVLRNGSKMFHLYSPDNVHIELLSTCYF